MSTTQEKLGHKVAIITGACVCVSESSIFWVRLIAVAKFVVCASFIIIACNASPAATPLDEIPSETLSKWRTVDVMRFPPGGSNRSATRVFSVRLPANWEVDGLRTGADSWGGALQGEGIRLSVMGGPFAVSELYEIVGGGPVEVDREKATRHIVTNEEINGIPANLVRPRDGISGFTGAILSMPTGTRQTEKLLLFGQGLSRDEQAVAFAIFRSIKP